MDHSGMSMSMSMGSTTTGTAAMASSTAAHSMGGMSMGGGSACKISMLWNWYTVDSCFLARSWHITSKAMFAGTCIGVILLVLALEFLRRAGKEYDRFIITSHARSRAPPTDTLLSASSSSSAKGPVASAAPASTSQQFRPSVLQQGIRALLHMLQFAVAYFVMLLAMYYNGYIIICIFIGAFLGYFIFGWESFHVGLDGKERLQEEVTVCCG